jgi:hypothetical protein
MVTLPPEPIFPDSPPAICAACDTEVPDYRRESYQPTSTHPFHQVAAYQAPAPVTPTPAPIETKRVSRAGLFRTLGGVLAERGENMVEDAKQRFGALDG